MQIAVEPIKGRSQCSDLVIPFSFLVGRTPIYCFAPQSLAVCRRLDEGMEEEAAAAARMSYDKRKKGGAASRQQIA